MFGMSKIGSIFSIFSPASPAQAPKPSEPSFLKTIENFYASSSTGNIDVEGYHAGNSFDPAFCVKEEKSIYSRYFDEGYSIYQAHKQFTEHSGPAAV